MANRHDVNAAGTPGSANGAVQGAVEALIERFGGLRPMADKLGVPVSTVQGWKKRGVIPANRQNEIKAAMIRLKLGDPAAHLDGVFRHDDPPAAAPVAIAPAPVAVSPPIQAVVAAAVETHSISAAASPAVVLESPPETETLSPAVAAEAVPPAVAAEAVPPAVAAEAVPPAVAAEAVVDKSSVVDNSVVITVVPVAAEQTRAAAIEAADIETVVESAPVISIAITHNAGTNDASTGATQEALVTEETPQTSEERAISEERPQGSQGAGVAIAAAVLAVIGAAVSVTAPLWSHEFLQRSVNVAAIEKRTADLESAIGATAGHGSALGERVGGVEKTLAALEARIAKAPAAAGALAARDLRVALTAGAPFAFEAALLRASGILGAEEIALLTALEPYAEKGAPTTQQVNERFAWVASSVVGAGIIGALPSMSLPAVTTELPGKVWSWASGFASAVGDMAGSIKVGGLAEALRLKDPSPADEVIPAAPVAQPAPDPALAPAAAALVPAAEPVAPSASAQLAEAGALLRQGDLASAVEVVARLDGKAAEATAAWLADARARLTADKAAAAIAAKAAKALQ